MRTTDEDRDRERQSRSPGERICELLQRRPVSAFRRSPEQLVPSQSVAAAALLLYPLVPASTDLAFPVLTDTPVPFKDNSSPTFPWSHRDQVIAETTTQLQTQRAGKELFLHFRQQRRHHRCLVIPSHPPCSKTCVPISFQDIRSKVSDLTLCHFSRHAATSVTGPSVNTTYRKCLPGVAVGEMVNALA